MMAASVTSTSTGSTTAKSEAIAETSTTRMPVIMVGSLLLFGFLLGF